MLRGESSIVLHNVVVTEGSVDESGRLGKRRKIY
jgi:hypothetical protein